MQHFHLNRYQKGVYAAGVGPVRMKRRFLAVVGMIALALAYLPGVVSVLSANPSPICCTGTLCPMHQMSAGHMNCGLDATHPASQACGCHTPQYTGGLVFNRVAPPLATSERPAGTAPALLQIASPNVEPEVLSPPPRTVPS